MAKIKCIFCNKPANTKEHIPPKQLFKGKPKRNLITVPSCKKCNESFQKDEDFFRQFWVSMLMDKSPKAKEMVNSEITRSIKRKPALAHQMFNQMKLVNVQTPGGIYLGKKTAYRLSDSDIKRTDRIIKKIIKGLFYHHFEATIPKDWVIKIVWITPKREKELKLRELASTLSWTVIKSDTFAYGLNYVPNTYQSIWLLDFLGTPLFYILVLDKKTSEGKK